MTAQLAPSPIFKGFDNNGFPLALGKLFTYAAGTTTPQATYVDSTQTTQNQNPVILNFRGECPLWLNPLLAYKFLLTDAFGNIIPGWPVDNIQGAIGVASNIVPSITNTFTLGTPTVTFANAYFGPNGAPLFDVATGNLGYLAPTPAETAAALALSIPIATFISKGEYAPGNMVRYGADPTGVALSDTPWTYANAQAAQTGGSNIVFPAGKFSTAVGFTVTTAGVRVTGAGIGLTILQATAASIWIIKLSQQFDSLADVQVNANGFGNVDGVVLAPANESSATVVNFNSYVDVERVWITNGCNNGIRMRGGPTVAGGDSQLFYCQFRSVFVENCIRGIWMQNAVNLGHGGSNACSFVGCRVAGDSSIANTGLQIDMGTGNMFFALHFEGIAFGTSPSSTPTAVVIAEANAAGGDNDDNQFFGTRCEANTHDLDNLNTLTQFYGGVWSQAKFGAAQNPTVMLTGDVSLQPLIIPGLQYSEGLSGFPSGYWGMSKEIADTGKEWQPYTLSTAIMTNVASISGGSVSNYRQLSSVVTWAAAFVFDASVGATQVTITPPVAPNTAQYTVIAGNNPFYTASVFNGTGYSQVPAGWTNTGKFYVGAPSGGWNTGGNNNQVFIQVDYHI